VDSNEVGWSVAELSFAVSTAAVLAVPAGRVWRSLLFYEEIEHAPPPLLRLLLPRPIRAEGRKEAGHLVRCTYKGGHILKLITSITEERLIAFDVVEQQLGIPGGIVLLGGSNAVEPLTEHLTRVTLTTRYRRPRRGLAEPLVAAVESKAVHAFHRHLIESIRRRATRQL
jgi:hypothetical protein